MPIVFITFQWFTIGLFSKCTKDANIKKYLLRIDTGCYVFNVLFLTDCNCNWLTLSSSTQKVEYIWLGILSKVSNLLKGSSLGHQVVAQNKYVCILLS